MVKRRSFPWLPLVLGSALGFAACATGVETQGVSQTTGSGGDDGTGGGAVVASTTHASGASKSASTGVEMSSSSTGVPTTCVKKEDCAGIADACNGGNCINGMCAKAPANDGSPCDDGLYCTDNDTCSMGMCVGGTMKFCPSPDSCHVGSCDEASQNCGSQPGNDGASCDDGDPCTYSGTCAAGTCSKGPPVDCSNFSSPCGDGVCDPVLGCLAKPKNEGTPCDDMLYCTINDKCTAGVCAGSPNTCAPPNDICKVGTCDEAQQTCVAVPGNNGAACDDGNPCHVNATCSAGTCTGGVPGNAGKACNDGNGCDKGETCTNGVCGNPVSKISQCIGGDMCCPPACNIATDSDCKPPCGGYVDPNIGGCWYLSALGDSCSSTCAAHGGYDSAKATHTGNPICTHFYPAKANGSNWMPSECCSTDNNTNWGATGMVTDPSWTFGSCYVACTCVN